MSKPEENKKKTQQEHAMNTDGCTSCVSLCDHLHKHKETPGTVTGGETPEFAYEKTLRLSDQENFEELSLK